MIEDPDKLITRGKFEKETGYRKSTIQYYTDEGLLAKNKHYEQDDRRLIRRYDKDETLRRLAEIRELQSEGLTIPEIKQKLKE